MNPNAPLLALCFALGGLPEEQASANGLDLIPRNERMQRHRLGIPCARAPKGTYAVEAHGDRHGVRGMTPERLAAVILHDPSYRRGTPVYLLSCETARSAFPQRLARLLNSTVHAPTERLWPLPSGSYIVAMQRPDGRGADVTRLGRMQKFQP